MIDYLKKILDKVLKHKEYDLKIFYFNAIFILLFEIIMLIYYGIRYQINLKILIALNFIILALLVISFILFILISEEKIKNNINLKCDLCKTDKEFLFNNLSKKTEIDALQSQIKPHFLYNTLESIRGQALIEGASGIADMTEALANFFRYSISLKGSIVTLEDELKNIDNYFLIQQYRFNNKFNIVKKFDDCDEGILECSIPKLTLQPIVENAIYHGLEPKIGKGIVVIRIYNTQDRIVIIISDNGIGMEKEKVEILNEKFNNAFKFISENKEHKKSGIALINVDRRIKLLFGEEYGIKIYSALEIGTDVEIVLPLIRKEENKTII